MVFSTLAKMPLHHGRSCRSSGNRRRCANFLSKPEGPGKTEGPGSGGSGAAERSGGRKVRAGPEGPGVAKLARTEKWGSWTWAEKLQEKPKSTGEKQGNWWKRRVGRLDLRATHKIHGSNPTKLQHTNKSQKNWGYFWWGFSKLGKNTTKLG